MESMRSAERGLLAAFLFMAACTPSSNETPVSRYLKDQRAAVFVFLAPDCPLSQSYTVTLNELRAKFHASSIEFYAVFAGRAGAEGAKDFVKIYGIQLPFLTDVNFQVADFLHATTTPEAFLLDGAGRTLYAGAIDNRAPELGKRRTVITENYLLDALENVVGGRTIVLQKTRPVGCFIERTRPS
jgi:hypothetical protein